MRKYRIVGRVRTEAALGVAILCAIAALAPMSSAEPSLASAQSQRSQLTVGGPRARSGVHPLRGGFSPDPFQVASRAGGPIHVADLRLGAGCRGYVDAQPDVIVRFSGSAPLLRFFARSGADVTLVVADPSGRFLCNDDVTPGRHTNPMVDVYAPRPGQYDVWIGARTAGESADATLFVTSSREQRP